MKDYKVNNENGLVVATVDVWNEVASDIMRLESTVNQQIGQSARSMQVIALFSQISNIQETFIKELGEGGNLTGTEISERAKDVLTKIAPITNQIVATVTRDIANSAKQPRDLIDY